MLLALQNGVQAQEYVLLVEDDDAFREILTYCLEHHGFRVVALPNGVDALAHLEDGGRPSAIICDITMPGVLGTTVAEYVKADPDRCDTPLVFMTADTRYAAPGSDIWVKPFRVLDMLAFVERATSAPSRG